MMVTFTAWVSRGDHKEKKKSYFGFKQSIHHIVGIEEKKKVQMTLFTKDLSFYIDTWSW